MSYSLHVVCSWQVLGLGLGVVGGAGGWFLVSLLVGGIFVTGWVARGGLGCVGGFVKLRARVGALFGLGEVGESVGSNADWRKGRGGIANERVRVLCRVE